MTTTLEATEARRGLPLCCCRTSVETLTALGFAVEVRSHCVGAWHVVQEGATFLEAREAARCAGLLSLVCVEHERAEATRKVVGFSVEAVEVLREVGAVSEAEATRLLALAGGAAEAA